MNKSESSATNPNDPVVGSALLSAHAWAAIKSRLHLKPIELEIIRAKFDDQREYEIARKLKKSEHTIHAYIQGLHNKLSISDKAQLILRVLSELHALILAPDSALPPLCPHHRAGQCPRSPGKVAKR